MAHIAEQPIEESGIDNNCMDTSNNQEKKKTNERRVVVMSHTNVDPGTVMVHLLHTSNRTKFPIEMILMTFGTLSEHQLNECTM